MISQRKLLWALLLILVNSALIGQTRKPQHTPGPPPTPTQPPAPIPGGQANTLYLGASELVFEGIVGTGSAATYAFPLIIFGTEKPWKITTTTTDGVDWLTVTPSSGMDNRQLSVFAAVGKLRAGVYSGKIVAQAEEISNSPLTVPVTFRVRDPIATTIRLVPEKVDFLSFELGTASSQTVSLQQFGEVILEWSASATTFNGGNWLTVTPLNGRDDTQLTLRANPSNLPLGTYAGRVTINSPSAVNNPITMNVVMNVVRGKASITENQPFHAATGIGGSVAPGSIVTLYGSRLGPRTPAVGQYNPSRRSFPTELGGTTVLFDRQAVPLLYVSYDQINLQVPYEVAGRIGGTIVTVSPAGFESNQFFVGFKETAPGLFTLDEKQAAALNQNNSINGALNPAAPGSVVQLFLTGQGTVNPPVDTGSIAPSEPLALPTKPVSAKLNGQPVEVKFAGLTPGAIGLMQVNIVVPGSQQASAAVPVSVKIGDVESPVAQIAVGK